jgi:cyclophilin family peptidyl-prolyl cis-trans isomerase
MKRNSYLLLCLAAVFLGTPVFAQTSTNQTNTVVRFRIGYGTTLYGNLDIELFDDKPITVTNFLKYLQSGAYVNSIIHDCRPGFALVGGFGTIANPYSSASFDILHRIPENPSITNEFNVGTPRSNVFGTIAMKKETSSPNSATTQWLINLANNNDGVGVTNLDTYLDGFTVFGRVIDGINVLNAFNEFTLSGGIADQINDLTSLHFCRGFYLYPGGDYVGFDALPVGFGGPAYLNCIQYNDLFTVQMSMLSGPDVVPPKAMITFPKNKASVTLAGETLTVKGTATDNVAVEAVNVYLNTGSPVAGTITDDNWTAIVTNVPPGTNEIFVEAKDAAGNMSQSAVKFFNSVRLPLSLAVEGDGTVSGAADGQLLELMRSYTLTARPKPGQLFVSWSGSVTSDSPKIRFVMESNLTFTANFVTNPFPAVSGVYNGLIRADGQVEQASSGYVSLSVRRSGTYSAKLLMNGRTHRFAGSFSPDGGETNLVDRPGTNSLLLRMALDLNGGTDQIIGSVTNNQVTAIDADHAWAAELRADRAYFDGRTHTAPQAGKYTIVIPRDIGSVSGPDGHGYGTVKISSKGAVSFTGALADGTKATQRTTVAKDGTWPVYLSLYKGSGALVSWVSFADETATDFSGPAKWFKQKQINARYYFAGFTNEMALLGSRYTPPTTSRVMDFEDRQQSGRRRRCRRPGNGTDRRGPTPSHHLGPWCRWLPSGFSGQGAD